MQAIIICGIYIAGLFENQNIFSQGLFLKMPGRKKILNALNYFQKFKKEGGERDIRHPLQAIELTQT